MLSRAPPQCADVGSQRRFGQADQLVAMDAAVVLQPLAGANRHLGGQPIVCGVDGRARDGNMAGCDLRLPADDDKLALAAGVAPGRPLNAMQLAAPQGSI